MPLLPVHWAHVTIPGFYLWLVCYNIKAYYCNVGYHYSFFLIGVQTLRYKQA